MAKNFFNMLPGQRLILISATNTTPPAAEPITSRSTNRRTRTTRAIALVQAIMILFCWYVGRPAISAARNAWPPITPGETLAWLRIGAMFLLFSIGTTAAILATRG